MRNPPAISVTQAHLGLSFSPKGQALCLASEIATEDAICYRVHSYQVESVPSLAGLEGWIRECFEHCISSDRQENWNITVAYPDMPLVDSLKRSIGVVINKSVLHWRIAEPVSKIQTGLGLIRGLIQEGRLICESSSQLELLGRELNGAIQLDGGWIVEPPIEALALSLGEAEYWHVCGLNRQGCSTAVRGSVTVPKFYPH